MSDLDLIRRYYDAWERRDVAAIFTMLHPEFEIIQTPELPWGGHHRGHAGAAHFLKIVSGLIEGFPKPERFIEAGGQIAVTARLKGKVKSTGKSFDLPVIDVWTLEAGLARRFEAYIDTPSMLSALQG